MSRMMHEEGHNGGGSLGDMLTDMRTEEKAKRGGIRRIPRSAELRALSKEALTTLFVDPTISTLERHIYEKELGRREGEEKREAAVVSSVRDVTDEVEVARAKVAANLQRFCEGELTAAQAAWAISLAVKVSFKNAELVLHGGFEFHHADGIEAKKGRVEGELARALITPAFAGAWRGAMESPSRTLADLSAAVKAGIDGADITAPPKSERVVSSKKSKPSLKAGGAKMRSGSVMLTGDAMTAKLIELGIIRQ